MMRYPSILICFAIALTNYACGSKDSGNTGNNDPSQNSGDANPDPLPAYEAATLAGTVAGTAWKMVVGKGTPKMFGDKLDLVVEFFEYQPVDSQTKEPIADNGTFAITLCPQE